MSGKGRNRRSEERGVTESCEIPTCAGSEEDAPRMLSQRGKQGKNTVRKANFACSFFVCVFLFSSLLRYNRESYKIFKVYIVMI